MNTNKESVTQTGIVGKIMKALVAQGWGMNDCAEFQMIINSHDALLGACHLAKVRLDSGTLANQAFNSGIVNEITKAINKAYEVK